MSNLRAMASKTPEIPQNHPILTQPAQSPLQLRAWAAALRSHPDAEFAGYLLEGIPHGFRIGYNHTDHKCLPARKNLPSAAEHPDIISKYLATEVANRRVVGPFPTCTTPEIQIN